MLDEKRSAAKAKGSALESGRGERGYPIFPPHIQGAWGLLCSREVLPGKF